jgi:hypothetical protein
MPPQKRKAEKMSRKDIVVIERSLQQLRESAYRIRAKLEPGLDEEVVEPQMVEKVRQANSALDSIFETVREVKAHIDAFDILEDME